MKKQKKDLATLNSSFLSLNSLFFIPPRTHSAQSTKYHFVILLSKVKSGNSP